VKNEGKEEREEDKQRESKERTPKDEGGSRKNLHQGAALHHSFLEELQWNGVGAAWDHSGGDGIGNYILTITRRVFLQTEELVGLIKCIYRSI
tara:strand:+ start:1021 stop:1299 length:279 start_codon:yes stop_codon:yes gene_type:complete